MTGGCSDILTHMTSIELNDEEVSAFLMFRKHQDLFQSMIDAHLHEVKGGQATLHFRPDGQLMNVELKTISLLNGKKVK